MRCTLRKDLSYYLMVFHNIKSQNAWGLGGPLGKLREWDGQANLSDHWEVPGQARGASKSTTTHFKHDTSNLFEDVLVFGESIINGSWLKAHGSWPRQKRRGNSNQKLYGSDLRPHLYLFSKSDNQ